MDHQTKSYHPTTGCQRSSLGRRQTCQRTWALLFSPLARSQRLPRQIQHARRVVARAEANRLREELDL